MSGFGWLINNNTGLAPESGLTMGMLSIGSLAFCLLIIKCGIKGGFIQDEPQMEELFSLRLIS